MGLLVVLVPADRDDLTLGPPAVEALARLGVTSVALARDDRTAAVILEGWAFDPGRPHAALSALGTTLAEARTLQPIVQMAVMAAPTEGEVHE
jgi:hypothetical protein